MHRKNEESPISPSPRISNFISSSSRFPLSTIFNYPSATYSKLIRDVIFFNRLVYSFLRIFHSNLIASLEEGLEKGKFYSYESTSSAGNAVADERGGIRNGTRFNDPAEARLLPSSLMEHGRRSVQHRFVGGGETVHAGSKSTRPCLNVRRIPVERDCVIRSFRSFPSVAAIVNYHAAFFYP